MSYLRNRIRKPLQCVLSLPLVLVLGFGSAQAQAPKEQPAPLLPWGAMPQDIPDGYMIVEGDIQVPIGLMPWSTDFWPGGSVVYEFDNNVTPEHRANQCLIPRRGQLRPHSLRAHPRLR